MGSATSELARPRPPTAPVKDGAKGARRVLALVSLSHGINHAYVSLLAIIFPFMMREFSLNYTEIGILATCGALTAGLLQAPVGILGRVMLRKFVIGLGALLNGAMTFTTATASTFAQLMVYRLLAGAGSSPQHPVGASLISDNFRQNRGMALGVHYAAGNIGFIVPTATASALLTHLGWRTTLALYAIPGVLIGLALILIVRETPLPRSAGRLNLFRGLRLMGERNLLLLIGIEFILAIRLSAVLTYMPAYFSNGLNMNLQDTSLLFTLLLTGSAIGPFLFGHLSDRIGGKTVGAIVVFSSAVFMYLLAVQKSGPLLVLDTILLGLTLYSVSAVFQALLANVVEMRFRDAAFAIYFTLGFGMGSIWSVLIGSVIDNFGFNVAFEVMGALTVMAGFLVMMIRESRGASTRAL